MVTDIYFDSRSEMMRCASQIGTDNALSLSLSLL